MRHLPDPSRIEVLDEAMVEVLKGKTVTQRVEMVFAANRTMRMMIAAHLRADHPDWSDEQIQAEVAGRFNRGTR